MTSSQRSSENKLDPEVEEDLNFILENNLDEIVTKYASYVSCLRAIIEKRRVTPKELRAYLLDLPAFSNNREGKKLTLMSDRKQELEEKNSIIDIFTFLSTECASFLNFGIFEKIIEKYDVTEEEKELNYPQELKAYIEKHKIEEFVKINPLLEKFMTGSEKLILKIDIETSSSLARVCNFKRRIAKILGLLPSALHILDIADGCVIVTFLIPTSIADYLFTPDTIFTSKQEEEFRAESVLWLKCNGRTFHWGKRKLGETESPGNP